MILRKAFAAALCLLLLSPTHALSDSLSISTWQTGDALNSVNLNARMNSISTWANGQIANDNIKSSAAIAASKIDLTSGTGRISHSTSVTDDAPVLTSAQTWNDAAEVFSAWRLTVTNTNSASTSRLIDLRVGSTIIASISRTGQFSLNPQNFASGPTTLMDGAWFNVASATMTDNVTAASGTAPRFIAYAFQRPAVAAANSSVTTTNAATLFIASAPVAGDNMTLTNRYALWVDQGDVRIGGNLFASGSMTLSGNLLYSGSSQWTVGATSNFRVVFLTNNLERMRITADGIVSFLGANTTNATAGDLVVANTLGLKSANAAANDTHYLVSMDVNGNAILGGGSAGRTKLFDDTQRLHLPVVAAGSLPVAGADEDGSVLIENNGVGDRNLIIYASGQRFRIDGGSAF